ncbi:MAG: cytochrome c peroxidase [Polyangiaceae bacterium]
MRVTSCCAVAFVLGVWVVGCKKAEPTAEQAAPSAASVAAAAEVPAGPRADDMKLPTLGPVPIPESNPMSEEKTALGQQLFFDKRLSADGSRACYSCHQNADGTGGHDPLAVGAKGKQLPRHSPVLWNVGYLPRFYWDGRSDTLEAQGTAAWAGGNMGVGKENLEAKAKEIEKLKGYKKQFDKVFPGKGVTPETIAQAISAYERTLVCDDTAYDRFAKGDKSALSAKQKEGIEIFLGKGQCVSCHTPPFFSVAYLGQEGAYFNTGRGVKDKKPEEVDVGRMTVTKKEDDWAAFKPPSLRNVSKSAPYFHDGSEPTLEDAVRFMASGGYDNPHKSPLLADRKLSPAEIQALVAFLEALECKGELKEPKLPEK